MLWTARPYRIDAERPSLRAGRGRRDRARPAARRLRCSRWTRDHAAPGACLVHPDPAARHALAAYACVGNEVRVRTGAGRRRARRGPGQARRGRPGDRRVRARRTWPGCAPATRWACARRGQGWRPPGCPGGRRDEPGPGPRSCSRCRPVTAARPDGPVTAGVRVIAAEPAGRQRDRPPGRRLGPGPAAARRPGRTARAIAAGRPGRGHRPGRAVQHGLPARLGDGRRGRARRQPAARPRARASRRILTGPAAALRRRRRSRRSRAA